jgi:hypothetical protein
MAFSIVQAWARVNTPAANGTSLVLGAVPAAGNLLVALTQKGNITDIQNAPTDNLGDGVAWQLAVGPDDNQIAERGYMWWKQVGTPSGGGKTITTTSAGATANCFLEAAEYAPGAVGTISLNGTPVNAKTANASPNAGSLTTVAAAASVIVAYGSCTGAAVTVGAGYTGRLFETVVNNTGIQDQFTSIAGVFPTAFTGGASGFCYALAAAFRVGAGALPPARKRGWYEYLSGFALSAVVAAVVTGWPGISTNLATYPGGPAGDPTTGRPVFGAADRPGGSNIPTAVYIYCDPNNGNDAWNGLAGQFTSGTTGPCKSFSVAWSKLVDGRGDWLMVANTTVYREGMGNLSGAKNGARAANPTVVSTYTPATWSSHVGDRTGIAQFGWDGTNGPTAQMLDFGNTFLSQHVVWENILLWDFQNTVVNGANQNSFGNVQLLSRSDGLSMNWMFYNFRIIGGNYSVQGDYSQDLTDYSRGTFTNGSATVTGVTTYGLGAGPANGAGGATSGNAPVNGHVMSLAGPLNNVPEGTTIVSGSGTATLTMSAPFTGTSGTYDFCTNLPRYSAKGIVHRRCVYAYAYAPGGAHSQGVYGHALDSIVWEDNVFHHNGHQGTNRNASFTNAGQQADGFKHNIYLSGECKNIIFRRNLSICASLTGAQIRCGGVVEGNAFGDNPIGLIAGLADSYAYARPLGVPAVIKSNVFSRSTNVVAGQAQGQGIAVGNLTSGTPVFSGDFLVSGGEQAYNIICDLGANSTANVFPLTNQASANQPSVLNYHDNIVWNWGNGSSNAGAGTSLGAYIGQGSGGPFWAQWSGSLTNNLTDTPIGPVTASGANITASNNTTAFGGLPDTSRSLATYATSLGYASISAMGDAAMNDPMTNWAVNAVNYVRAGFGH